MVEKRYRNSRLSSKNPLTLTTRALPGLLISGNLNFNPEYKNIIRRVLSTKQLDEVDKCVLLCRKCHGILHAQNINAELVITSIVDDQKATQRFKGQMIVDLKENNFAFLTNERMLLIPYHVEIGSTKPRTLFGVQLEKEELLISFLKDIEKFKTIKIG